MKDCCSMGTRKTTKKHTQDADSQTAQAIKSLLEQIVADAAASPQPDSFYAAKVRALEAIDREFFSVFTKFFLKADYREQELLLPLLRHVQGIAHITFLQDFIRREPFLPRTGMMILELFNKSDAMLEAGVASRLLDLDSLARRITHGLVQGSIDKGLIEEFFHLTPNERNGMLAQLRDEAGEKCALFVARALDADPRQGMQILEILTQKPDQLSLTLLNEVYAKTGSKDVAKALKKKAHALRQKGVSIDIPVPEKKESPVFQQAVLPEPRAFISVVDADGARIVFMIKPVSIYEAKIFNILMSDRKGIHDIEVITALRRETRTFINRLMADTKIEFLETAVDHAAFLVEEACKISRQSGGIIPETFAQLQNAFADTFGLRQTPLVYDYISQDEIETARQKGYSSQLIEATRSVFWFAVTPEARDAWIKLANILTGPHALSEEEKVAKLDEMVRETAAQFFTPDRCRQFRRRFEEEALFLCKKDRREIAAAALAAAQDLTDSQFKPAEHALCRDIIRSGFALFEKAYKKPEPAGRTGRDSGSSSTVLSA